MVVRSYLLLSCKKTFLILNLVCLITQGFSQVITGRIVDSDTNTGINSAAVYFSGTSNGALTDKEGHFKLDISNSRSMPVTISALGYNSITLGNYSNNKHYLIYLSPKVYELHEVVITAKHGRDRRTNLKIFKNEFLGATMNAISCDISNEDDLLLSYIPGSDTLIAFSSNPVIINNNALGYKITYYLDKFEYSRSKKYIKISGNYIYSADTSNINNQQTRFERKRKTAYLGSRMHFFRALWENNLDQAGFVVKDSANETLTYERFVDQTNSVNDTHQTKYIRNQGNLFISYHSLNPQSQIIILKDTVYFNEDGYFDPSGIAWQGEMARQRIGDLLPFDYTPDEKSP